MSRLGISTCKEIVKIGWHKFQERERREKKDLEGVVKL
jgi:hypothetical protein